MGVARLLMDFGLNEAGEQAMLDAPHYMETDEQLSNPDNDFHQNGDPSIAQHAKYSAKLGWQDIKDYPLANAFELVNLAPSVAGLPGLAAGLVLDAAVTPVYNYIRGFEDVVRNRIQTEDPNKPGYIVRHKHAGLTGEPRERNWYGDVQDRAAYLNDEMAGAAYDIYDGLVKPKIDAVRDSWDTINNYKKQNRKSQWSILDVKRQ